MKYSYIFARANTAVQWLGTSADDTHDGSAARDAMAGNGGNDTLNGLGGDDTLFGDSGNDTLNGGAGVDVLEGGLGADHINGGAGEDTLSYYYGPAVNFALDGSIIATGDAFGDVVTSIEIISGSKEGSDKLGGDSHDNTIYGNGGDDQLFGFGGKDVLIGGTGSDTLDGGTGDDTMSGGEGSDFFIGDTGLDLVTYSNDAAVTASLDPLVFANAGAALGDLFDGIENLSGSSTKGDKLSGDAKANNLFGNGGNDLLYGQRGNDTLYGGKGTDALYGGDGDDSLLGGDGGDRLIGGTGIDLVTYYSDKAVTAALDHSFVSAGAAAGDTFTGIENLAGSNTGNDKLAGDAKDNQLFGNGGNDSLKGQAGNDLLAGGTGADMMDGGKGIDVVSYITDAAATVALDGSIRNTGSAAGDHLSNIEDLSGSASGKDHLVGNAAANALYGNGGDDILAGQKGNDRLFGGIGSDKLSGGAGNDQFFLFNVFEAGDTITDFANGDIIVLEGSGFGLGQFTGPLNFTRFSFDGPHDANDNFIYNQPTHTLLFDSDGSGSAKAVKLFTFTNSLDFTPEYIYII
jgi:Ca2+-binding RTX toxin-like protein